MVLDKPESLEIPDKATSAQLYIRHTKSVQDGDPFQRTITPEGVQLCRDVEENYLTLLQLLEASFGRASFYASEMIRSELTAWELFRPAALIRSPLLNVIGSFKDEPYYQPAKDKGMTTPEIISGYLQEHWPVQGDFATAYDNHRQFLDAQDVPLVIATCHEIGISMLRRGTGATDYLGLKECQGMIFYLSQDNTIVEMQDHFPQATLVA